MKSSVTKLLKASWIKEANGKSVKGEPMLGDGWTFTVYFDYIQTTDKLVRETNEILTDVVTITGSLQWDTREKACNTSQAFLAHLVTMHNGKIRQMLNHESAAQILSGDYVDAMVYNAVDFVIDKKGVIVTNQEQGEVGMYKSSFEF